MKNNICFVVLIICILLIGCENNIKSPGPNIGPGTDSSMMNRNGIDANTTGDVVTYSSKKLTSKQDSLKIKAGGVDKIKTDSTDTKNTGMDKKAIIKSK